MVPDGAAESLPLNLLVVRHGESEWNAQGRWQGQADPELSPRGLEQAERAAGALAGVTIDLVVASDLIRARRTAEIIAGRLGINEVTIDRGLREVDVGEWTGLTRPEIEVRWPNLLSDWTLGALESTPGGESLTALRKRVTEAVGRIVAAASTIPDLRTVLVVTHRRAISALEESLNIRPVRAGNLAGRRFISAGSNDIRPAEPVDLLGGLHEISPGDQPGYG